jgi:hypothetical protein
MHSPTDASISCLYERGDAWRRPNPAWLRTDCMILVLGTVPLARACVAGGYHWVRIAAQMHAEATGRYQLRHQHSLTRDPIAVSNYELFS